MTGVGSSCGACKFLRRKCSSDCVFAPYFSYEQAASHFSAVHKVFGASNASKLLSHLPLHSRNDAAVTISYEALARMHDPIYGCVAHIFALQQQVATLKEEIESIGNQIAVNNLGIIDTTSSSSCTVMSKETCSPSVFVHQQQGGSYIPTQYGSAYASVNDSFSLQNMLGLTTDDDELSQAYFDPTTLATLLEEIS